MERRNPRNRVIPASSQARGVPLSGRTAFPGALRCAPGAAGAAASASRPAAGRSAGTRDGRAGAAGAAGRNSGTAGTERHHLGQQHGDRARRGHGRLAHAGFPSGRRFLVEEPVSWRSPAPASRTPRLLRSLRYQSRARSKRHKRANSQADASTGHPSSLRKHPNSPIGQLLCRRPGVWMRGSNARTGAAAVSRSVRRG